MGSNGHVRNPSEGADSLRWTGRVLALEDVRRNVNGHRELVLPPRAVITPLAAEELRARGVRINRLPIDDKQSSKGPTSPSAWGVAQQRPHPLVASAVQALGREGLALNELAVSAGSSPGEWAKAVADCVARGECQGGVVFCEDPGLVCCVANKLPGLRALAVATVAQAARAALTLGANLAAVEMPGRTFFEVRQILRTLCMPAAVECPAGVACVLRELDGHAHR